MNDELKQLREEIIKTNKKVDDLILQIKRDNTRDYTQNKVFNDRVTFRGEVYNKAGTKVIN